jgi:hypothetical protein
LISGVGKYAASLGGHPFATSVVRSNQVSLSLQITQNGCLLPFFPFVQWWGWVAAAQRSFRVCEENGAKAEPMS